MLTHISLRTSSSVICSYFQKSRIVRLFLDKLIEFFIYYSSGDLYLLSEGALRGLGWANEEYFVGLDIREKIEWFHGVVR